MSKKIVNIPQHSITGSTPQTPDPGFSKIYVKPNKKWYWLDDDGLEVPFKTELPISAVFVSQDGNDATAQKYRLDLPYQTIEAAKLAASLGDTIVVLPGSYLVNSSILKDGVNYYFYQGVVLTSFAIPGIFSDVNEPGPVDCTVRGHANIYSFPYFSGGLVVTSKNGTYLDIEINNAVCYSSATFLIAGNDTKVYFKFNEITENLQYGSNIGRNPFQGNIHTSPYLNLKGRKFTNNLNQGGNIIHLRRHNGGLAVDAEIDLVISSATNNWGALMADDCNGNPIINFKGKVVHTPLFLAFMNSAIIGYGPAEINFEGEIVTPVSAVALFGGFGNPSNRKISIKNSVIKQEGNTTNFPLIRSSNPGEKIIVSNSRLIGKSTHGLCTTGYTFVFGDSGQGGKIELSNVDLINYYSDNSNPSSMLGINNSASGSDLILNRVTAYNNATNPQYFINTGGNPENVKILQSFSNVNNNPLITNTVNGYELVDSQITLLD